MKFRTPTTDRVILTGWLALAVLGQSVFNIEVQALEVVAALWLFAGFLIVRQTTCLPLLLLTCPIFMGEIQRAWAWVQWVAVILLLIRVLVENRFTLRQWLTILLAGTLVLAFSWPGNAGELLAELIRYSKRDLLHQWFHAQAVWSIFPFRESVDRVLIAMTCAALLLNGGCFSSHRLWKALGACGVLALTAAFSASLLPWQKPHCFLGTTNHGQYAQFLFQGAGTNLSFFAILLAVGLPWWFAPLTTRWRAVLLGMTGFLFPLLLVQERAFFLAVVVLTTAGILWYLGSLVCSRRRSKVLSRWRLPAKAWRMAGVLFVAGCFVSGYWYEKMGIRNESSLLRAELRAGALSRGRSAAAPVPAPALQSTDPTVTRDDPPAISGPPPTGAEIAPPLPVLKRVEQWLSRHDAIRGPAWALGLDHMLKHSWWKGAGAGTWARFHRSQPRPYRDYLAHMHNTYLDLTFEYGLIPMMILFGLCAVAFFGIAFGYCGVSRLWLLYLVPIAIMALGQHLFYAFTHLCLLLPAFILIPRALLGMFHKDAAGVVR